MSNYLITGASGGMGKALTCQLIKAGHNVWGIDINPPLTGSDPVPVDSSGSRSDPVPADCAAFANSPSYNFIKADITDRNALVAAVDRVRIELTASESADPEQGSGGESGLDAIVNMAGIYDLYSLAEIEEERFIRDFNVNLFGMYRVNQLFLPLLKPRGRTLVVSSELATLEPLPFTGIYALTKAAVEKYACALRMELQLLGHPVVVIRPGAVATDLLPASVNRLNEFCAETRLYPLTSDRFRRVVNRVESRSITPDRLAACVVRALRARRPRLVYNVNRNPLLLLLNILPARLRLYIIKRILT